MSAPAGGPGEGAPRAQAPGDGGAPLLLLLSGPNLGLLGERQPAVYGRATLDDHVARARAVAEAAGWRLEHHQREHEGDLVELVHGARGSAGAIVVNAGALTHYGWSLHDALATFEGPIVELHLSNPSAREPWRHTSVIAPVVAGTIAGFGGLGYELAVQAAIRLAAAGAPPDPPARTIES